jgi:hypothetical protein
MLTRRHLVVLLLGSLAVTRSVRSQQDNRVTVRIRADQTAVQALPPIERKNLHIEPDTSDEGKKLAAQVPPGRALPILVIIAGAIAVTELLQMIKELYRQTYYGGVLIDTCSQPPNITSDLRIPASMVFVTDCDGKTTQYTSDQFSLDALKVALKVK